MIQPQIVAVGRLVHWTLHQQIIHVNHNFPNGWSLSAAIPTLGSSSLSGGLACE
jgi:hypothetical protein